jgi:hypothetical protein
VLERLGPPGNNFHAKNGDKAIHYGCVVTVMKEWSFDPTGKLIFYTHQTPYRYGATFVFDKREVVRDIREQGK